jgi:hypothetical protein
VGVLCPLARLGQRMACGPERTAPTWPIWAEADWGPYWQGPGLVAGAGPSAPSIAGSGPCLAAVPGQLE